MELGLERLREERDAGLARVPGAVEDQDDALFADTGLFPVVIETLMTCAPSSAASVMPWARAAEVPDSWLFTLIDKILASGATPSNGLPSACMSLAAMMPATPVPWP